MFGLPHSHTILYVHTCGCECLFQEVNAPASKIPVQFYNRKKTGGTNVCQLPMYCWGYVLVLVMPAGHKM